MLVKGQCSVKCWQFSGESKPGGQQDLETEILQNPGNESDQQPVMLKGTHDNLRVLGLGWNPANDTIVFEVTLNFSRKKRGVRRGPNLSETDLPSSLPTKDNPLGLICPFTLMAKVYLGETWSQKLEWDDQQFYCPLQARMSKPRPMFATG